jgi:RNA 2',3'-cyclic 3'-phosphodiesterase
VRLFFALWPPQEIALALEHWTQVLDGRRTSREKIHMTLAYLGEADAQKAANAGRRVQAPPFRLVLDEASYWSHNKIVWVGPRRVPAEMTTLVQALQLELYKESFILERRPFAAHVTLVRKAPAQPLPALQPIEWPVKELALVASAGGAYRTLERFALG